MTREQDEQDEQDLEDLGLGPDWDAAIVEDVHPLVALSIVSAAWLFVFGILLGFSEFVRWFCSFVV